MNGCDKKMLLLFQNKITTSYKNCWWNNIYRLAWEYCRKSSTFIASISCFHIMEEETGIPNIPVNKKENLSGWSSIFWKPEKIQVWRCQQPGIDRWDLNCTLL